ncbi:MAG: hypothetical protein HWD59_05835 [Coxiellaceae bacterium]|nr:MAG: hypothetical protein HWD59_05835 [Coxiellaceae bacterium]
MSNGITRWVGLATLITSCVTTTYAADQDVDLPALPEYYAQKQPVPLSQRAKEATAVKGLKGFYFGGKALYGNLSVDNITRQGPAALLAQSIQQRH